MEDLIWVRDNIYRKSYIFNGKPNNRYYVKIVCSVCGKQIFADRQNRKKAKAAICSKECKVQLLSSRRPEKIFKNGLGSSVMQLALGHPHKNNQGRVCEHRLVIERSINRYLTKIEQIHHINMDKTDNRIENLDLMSTQSIHFKTHGSLNKCVKELLEKKILLYNKERKEYKVDLRSR